MNNDKNEILIRSSKEYYSSGIDEFEKERYNSAVVLFFKSLIALTDLYILQQSGDTPSSHAARFKVTKEKFPDVYEILDKDFPFYQSSYVQILSKELAEIIQDDVKIMAEKAKVGL